MKLAFSKGCHKMAKGKEFLYFINIPQGWPKNIEHSFIDYAKGLLKNPCSDDLIIDKYICA